MTKRVIAARPVISTQGEFVRGEPYTPRSKKEGEELLNSRSWREERKGDAEAWSNRLKRDPVLRAKSEASSKVEADGDSKGKVEKEAKPPSGKDQPVAKIEKEAKPGVSDSSLKL